MKKFKILYILDGSYLSFNWLTLYTPYRENADFYLEYIIMLCNNNKYAHIWNLPNNTNFSKEEFEVIYD